MKTLYSKLLMAIMVGLFALAVTGCNTVEGFGKDVQKGGEALEESAEENRKY
ncbi:entericidin A/B family lipoprotein [Nitrincola sp. MINF-07-Sa-05]|uniref:entericidin A/B family lipoprotein n=1 Tax=Nitrincola salilacus TaxID=3400273 RepID=UPI003917F545